MVDGRILVVIFVCILIFVLLVLICLFLYLQNRILRNILLKIDEDSTFKTLFFKEIQEMGNKLLENNKDNNKVIKEDIDSEEVRGTHAKLPSETEANNIVDEEYHEPTQEELDAAANDFADSIVEEVEE